jgi:uridine kinase
MQTPSKLIAIVGGSGAGKTWLARRLERELHPVATRLSLDDFYLDRSSLPPSRRATLNYDHPRAIDWPRFEATLHNCRAGSFSFIPRYDFATHTRHRDAEFFTPAPVVLVDGLWLLVRPRVRALFDFSIYLDCPAALRLERRLARDNGERGRTANNVREQFHRTVAPMHERFVAPQTSAANWVLHRPPASVEVKKLAATIRALLPPPETEMENEFAIDAPQFELADFIRQSDSQLVRPHA